MMLCMLAVPVMLTSCSDDDDDNGVKDPYSAGWFAGKQFSAECDACNVNAATIDWWILSMDGKGGAGYDGRFTVVPYKDIEDADGNLIGGEVVRGHKSYSGTYQVDFNNNRLFITYDGYSANSVWYFGDEADQDEWPYYEPNRYIQIPANATGELAGLTFFSGAIFQ